MRFSCESGALQRGVSVVQNVAQSKIANPIIENVLVIAEGKEVLFIGTNLTQTIRCAVEAAVEEEGQIAVPAKYIGSLAREIGEGKVNVTVKGSQVRIRCGKSNYRLGGMSAEEFPPFLPLSEGEAASFTSAELGEVVRKTIFCTSSEKASFELGGVKVEGQGKRVVFVATDGRRLSLVGLESEAALEAKIAALVPTRTWQELARAMREGQGVQVMIGESKIMFEAGDMTLLSSLLGDNFPPYDLIIPKTFAKRVVLKREDLERAVRRACVLASESTNQVTLAISEGEVVVQGESQTIGEARDVVEVEYRGEPIKVSYKGDYILDFLRSVSSEKVTIEINDASTPAGYRELDNENYTHIIMPMKVREEEASTEKDQG